MYIRNEEEIIDELLKNCDTIVQIEQAKNGYRICYSNGQVFLGKYKTMKEAKAAMKARGYTHARVFDKNGNFLGVCVL
ncbi:MAG: hypothetical protein C0P72_010210 [Clostridia bacterium]